MTKVLCIVIAGFMLLVLDLSDATAQSVVDKTRCSAHFQARANWLGALGGHSVAQIYMERRAEGLWHAIPRDCGMHTGFGNADCRYDPDRSLVLTIMSRWADEGVGFEPRPTCMEDRYCLHCVDLFNRVAQ